jgi:sterol carrier protein 2
MGLGGATVVTIYKRADGMVAPKVGEYRPEDDGRCRLGYNPAVEARGISKADWEAVKSRGNGSSKWAAAKLPWVVDGKGFKERAML